MIPGFEALVEQRIKKAQEDGGFDNLEKAGKPLRFEQDAHIPSELRLSHKILKNAGFLPPEVELKKKIAKEEQLLEAMGDEPVKKAKLQKKINYLVTKLDTLRQDRGCSPILSGQYSSRVIKKIS